MGIYKKVGTGEIMRYFLITILCLAPFCMADDYTSDQLPESGYENTLDVGTALLPWRAFYGGLFDDGTWRMTGGVGTGLVSLTDGTASWSSSSLSGFINGTFTGTLTAEQLTSTDDATIADDLAVGGTGTFGQIIDSGLTASLGVYTDASKQLTSTPPTSGILGYWTRAGTVISTATAGDDISTTGDLNIGTGGTVLDVDSNLGTVGIGREAITNQGITANLGTSGAVFYQEADNKGIQIIGYDDSNHFKLDISAGSHTDGNLAGINLQSTGGKMRFITPAGQHMVFRSGLSLFFDLANRDGTAYMTIRNSAFGTLFKVDSLGDVILAAGEGGASAKFYMWGDRHDDAGDGWLTQVADGGVWTLGNDIAVKDTYVPHITITPNATPSDATIELHDTFITTEARIKNETRYTTTQAMAAADHIVFGNTDGGAWTYTLEGSPDSGRTIKIINSGESGNDLTIDENGNELLGDISTFALADGEALMITYNSTDGWY